MFELSPGSTLGQASRSVRAVLSSTSLHLGPLALMVERWILKDDLSNFKELSPHLSRGGQPLGNGYEELKSKGVKTIINLRRIDTGKGMDFSYFHIPIHPSAPKKEDVIAFLKVIDEKAKKPIYIHCFHGSDRTGLFVAIYRIVYEGWTKEQAITEMVHGGYGFHLSFQQNLVKFLQDLDLEELMQIRQSQRLIGKSP